MAKRKATITKLEKLIKLLNDNKVREYQDGDLKLSFFFEQDQAKIEFKETETAESTFNKKFLKLASLGRGETDV